MEGREAGGGGGGGQKDPPTSFSQVTSTNGGIYFPNYWAQKKVFLVKYL